MRKLLRTILPIVGLAACSSVLAANVYCPAYVTAQGASFNIGNYGGEWRATDTPEIDGIYYFSSASETQPMIYCIYKFPPRRPGEKAYGVTFTNVNTGKYISDVNAAGSKWRTASVNRGCNSSNPFDCPYAQVGGNK